VFRTIAGSIVPFIVENLRLHEGQRYKELEALFPVLPLEGKLAS